MEMESNQSVRVMDVPNSYASDELFSISPMCQEDIPSLARLEEECFSEPWSEQSLAVELDNDTAHFFVAKSSDGTVVGYAGMHDVFGEGYIANIAVSAPWRGRGVGRLLVGSLVGYAQEKKFDFLTLEVRASNEAAISLYRTEGFELVGKRKDFYRNPQEDALLMTRRFLVRESESEI